jgi:large subunit ribosomal protein L15
MNFKRKKNSRQRGTHTHGCGSKKKRRGAGHRGGRGNAGSGKRADAKKPSFWKDTKRYGKSGFTSKVRNDATTINIAELQTKINTFITKGKAKLNNNVYSVDLSLLKIDKLLGAGKISSKFEIKVNSASKLAIEKVEKAGGKVILPTEKKVEVKKPIEKPVKPKVE